jgi:hypothetical protein
MQLKTDNRCRLASRDFFRPNTSYEVERTADGSIKLVELVPKPTTKAKVVKKNGRLVLDIGRPFDADELTKALEDYL